MRALRFILAAGLLCMYARPAAAVPILLNSSFESGTFSEWDVDQGPVSLLDVSDRHPHTGDFAARFGGANLGAGLEDSISQTIDTSVGQLYAIHFWLMAAAPGCTPAFLYCLDNDWTVQWNGMRVASHQQQQPFAYTEYSFMVPAAAPRSTLSFSMANGSGFYYLDDVSVDAVPEASSWILLATGLVGVVLMRRRRAAARG